ncbi:hypothetical protein [Deinococcus hopiensis]|uniref:hypothetical protein n=1 Tax=Deinococcus hopiensis TaxID=309885 RepID=UPI00111BDFCB|nr:hypothetical protein [Deinococcus hopiensis]
MTGINVVDGTPASTASGTRSAGTGLRRMGAVLVVYRHTPVYRVRWMHNTVDIGTGCAFGDALTHIRPYPQYLHARREIALQLHLTYPDPT